MKNRCTKNSDHMRKIKQLLRANCSSLNNGYDFSIIIETKSEDYKITINLSRSKKNHKQLYEMTVVKPLNL